MATLISPENHVALWAIIVSGTALSIWLEQKYRWASRLSGPVLALLIAMVLSNLRVPVLNARIVPTESPAYDFIGDWLVPLAIPLLLFRANLREIIGTTGRMFVVFHIAALGTLIGTALAVMLLRTAIPMPDLAHASGMMAASYIGGGVNFMAIKASYNVRENVANPLIVADNFVMAAVFVLLLVLAASRWLCARYTHTPGVNPETSSTENLAAAHWQRKGIALLDIAWAFTFAFIVFALASVSGRLLKGVFGDTTHAGWHIQMLAVLCTNKFVLLTLFSLLFATFFARPLAKVNGPEEFGAYLLAIFLFSLGLPADLITVLRDAPMFFVFCGVIAAVNLGFTLLVGKLFRLHLEELLLSVNATLGGAPSAAAMAISAGWPRLVLPGILVGIWGYVIGTPIGVVIVEILRRNSP